MGSRWRGQGKVGGWEVERSKDSTRGGGWGKVELVLDLVLMVLMVLELVL